MSQRPRQPRKRYTVSLSPEVGDQVERAALEQDRSLQSMLAHFVRVGLKVEDVERSAASPAPGKPQLG